jgi:hypothetical protein
MRALILLLLVGTFYSCKPRLENEKTISSLSIHSKFFGSLDRFSTRISHVKDDTLFFVDEQGTRLTKFSLADQQVTQVELELIDGFRPSKLHYISTDSILFYDGSHLLLHREDGTDQQKFSLFEGVPQIAQEVYAEFPYERIATNLVYLPNRKSVLFYFAKADATKKRIFAAYSLETKTWTSFPIYHPAEFDGVELNYTTFPSVAVGTGGFAFIYSISPKISSFSFDGQVQQEVQISSFSGKQTAESQTIRDSWDQAYFRNWVMTSPNYLKLLYDPYRKVYYRISQEALGKEAPVEEDYYTYLLRNRQLYLTVLNEKLEVLGNYPLEKGKYDPSGAFVFSSGLWFPYAVELMEEEGLSGDLVTLDDKL